jgi:hypothetical protein
MMLGSFLTPDLEQSMKLNQWLSIASLTTLMLLVGCGEKKQLTAEQQWQQFCKIYEGAAVNVMFDRQNGISKEKSIEHILKMPEGKERHMILGLVDQAHLVAKFDQQGEKDRAMAEFKSGKYQQCLASAD